MTETVRPGVRRHVGAIIPPAQKSEFLYQELVNSCALCAFLRSPPALYVVLIVFSRAIPA